MTSSAVTAQCFKYTNNFFDFHKTLTISKAVIHDDSLTDNECFMKIEEIICVFEALGSNGGTRHDFG